MFWEELSWLKLSEVDLQTPVIIPLGACEQHGRHLPLGVDTCQVAEIARRVEANLGPRVLCLPTLWLGSSSHHQDFPGTLSLLPSLYAQVIQELTRSILESGFKRLLFLNGHGGNKAPVTNALTELVAEDDDAYLALASWWEIGLPSPQKIGLSQPVMSHACEYETSLMLVLRPDLVDLSQAKHHPPVLDNTWFHSEDDSRKRVSVFRRFHRFTADGSLGRPEEGTAEKGQAILESVTEQLVAFLSDFQSWPELSPLGPKK